MFGLVPCFDFWKFFFFLAFNIFQCIFFIIIAHTVLSWNFYEISFFLLAFNSDEINLSTELNAEYFTCASTTYYTINVHRVLAFVYIETINIYTHIIYAIAIASYREREYKWNNTADFTTISLFYIFTFVTGFVVTWWCIYG